MLEMFKHAKPTAELPRQEEYNGPLANVTVGAKLVDKNNPYTVQTDAKRFTQLLLDMGMSPNNIDKYSLNITGQGIKINVDGGVAYGYFAQRKKQINVYTSQRWYEYTRTLECAEELSQKNSLKESTDITNDDFSDLLTTKKLPMYLKSAPPERALPFAKKLISSALQHHLDNTLIHECVHAVVHTNRLDSIKYRISSIVTHLKHSPLQILSGLGLSALLSVSLEGFSEAERALIGIMAFFTGGIVTEAFRNDASKINIYLNRPEEKLARDVASHLESMPKYKGIVKLVKNE